MSEDAILWMFGILIASLFGLIGVVWTMLLHRLERLETLVEKVVTETRDWQREKDRFDHNFRHNEYAPTVTRINYELFPLTTLVPRLEKQIAELNEWRNKTVKTNRP